MAGKGRGLGFRHLEGTAPENWRTAEVRIRIASAQIVAERGSPCGARRRSRGRIVQAHGQGAMWRNSRLASQEWAMKRVKRTTGSGGATGIRGSVCIADRDVRHVAHRALTDSERRKSPMTTSGVRSRSAQVLLTQAASVA